MILTKTVSDLERERFPPQATPVMTSAAVSSMWNWLSVQTNTLVTLAARKPTTQALYHNSCTNPVLGDDITGSGGEKNRTFFNLTDTTTTTHRRHRVHPARLLLWKETNLNDGGLSGRQKSPVCSSQPEFTSIWLEAGVISCPWRPHVVLTVMKLWKISHVLGQSNLQGCAAPWQNQTRHDVLMEKDRMQDYLQSGKTKILP